MILCLYLSRSSENLSMKALLLWSQVSASPIESACHSAAAPRRSEENMSLFWLNIVLLQRCQLFVIQARSWFCFQLWLKAILPLGRDRYPKNCLRPSQGTILCSLLLSVVSCFVGVFLSTVSCNHFKVVYGIKLFPLSYLSLSYDEPSLWSVIELVREVPSVWGL